MKLRQLLEKLYGMYEKYKSERMRTKPRKSPTYDEHVKMSRFDGTAYIDAALMLVPAEDVTLISRGYVMKESAARLSMELNDGLRALHALLARQTQSQLDNGDLYRIGKLGDGEVAQYILFKGCRVYFGLEIEEIIDRSEQRKQVRAVVRAAESFLYGEASIS